MLKRTLYFTNQAFLSVEHQQLVVEQRGSDGTRIKKTMPIEDLGYVIIESPQVTMTAYCLQSLAANKTAVLFSNEKHLPASVLLPLEGHTQQQEHVEFQLQASAALKERLWRQTVQSKILNQAQCLEICGLSGEKLRIIAQNVKKDDANNAEAVAARYYFQAHGLIRNTEALDVNMALNYGYAVLRAATARALVSSGLLCCVGIHHCNKYNAFCLADDIMEPYRPFVDQLVFSKEGAFSLSMTDQLTREMKSQFLSLLACDVIMNSKMFALANALSMTSASLTKCFSGEEKQIAYPQLKM